MGARFAAASVLIGCLASPGRAADVPSAGDSLRAAVGGDFLVRVGDDTTTATVRTALADASRLLGRAECRTVLTDFSDARGRTLQERLDSHEVSAREFLRLIVFMNGASTPQCRRSTVVAFTAVGSRVVFVCPASFRETVSIDSDLGASLLIHEMLHSLGLEENPPTSLQITRRVMDRCMPQTLYASADTGAALKMQRKRR